MSEKNRAETQRFAVLNVLVSRTGEQLTSNEVQRIADEILTEIRSGPTAWAFASSTDKVIEIVKREIDNCDHPECQYDRETYGYSKCAGGHIARRIVGVIKKEFKI